MPGILLLPFRIAVFLIGLVAYWMEIAADWLVGARDRTEYVREGGCLRCGRCCRCLSLIMPKGVSSRDRLVRAVRLWHRLGMNFQFIAEEEGWLVYRCGYYREARPPRLASQETSSQKDMEIGRGSRGGRGRCSIYPFRHRLCRFFPRQGLYGHPSLHADCGFHFVRREVATRRHWIRRKGKQTFDDVLCHSSSEGESGKS